MNRHAHYRFSVTIHTDLLSLLSSMRGLAQHCQIDGIKAIAWGGTKEPDWAGNSNRATFHFSRPLYRDTFVQEAEKLFSKALWEIIAKSDSDPAVPRT